MSCSRLQLLLVLELLAGSDTEATVAFWGSIKCPNSKSSFKIFRSFWGIKVGSKFKPLVPLPGSPRVGSKGRGSKSRVWPVRVDPTRGSDPSENLEIATRVLPYCIFEFSKIQKNWKNFFLYFWFLREKNFKNIAGRTRGLTRDPRVWLKPAGAGWTRGSTRPAETLCVTHFIYYFI